MDKEHYLHDASNICDEDPAKNTAVLLKNERRFESEKKKENGESVLERKEKKNFLFFNISETGKGSLNKEKIMKKGT